MRAPKKLEVHVFHHAGKPGIGAVVAMVAAARTALGYRKADDPDGDGVYCSGVRMGGFTLPACGRFSFRLAENCDVQDIDCPHCLRMHAMVYGGAE